MKEVNAILGKDIFLGRCGENKATCVSFNISDWQKTYGDGTPYVLHQRNGDKQPYPCDIEVNGSIVTWCITNSDVAVAGRGRVELQYYKDDTLVKSETFTTVTERGLGTPSETAPPPYEGWLENILGTATEAQEAAAEAVESASAASKSESNAKASEEAALRAEELARNSANESVLNQKAAANNALSAANHANRAIEEANAAGNHADAAEEARAKAEASAQAAASDADRAEAVRDSIVLDEAKMEQAKASAEASAREAAASKTAAANSASAAASSAAAAEQHKIGAWSAAETSQANAQISNDNMKRAEAAQAAAEKARDEAESISSGAGASVEYVALKVQEAEDNANAYTDQKIATIPTPDVSGQINTHNTSGAAHSDIRTAVANAETNANKYTDQKIAAIPAPDVSGQINAHNANGEAHADIRQIAHNAASLATSANATAEAASRNADWAYEEATGKASIFYCYADSTELWEIDEQIDNGNIVILNDIDRYVPLVSANYGSSYLFRGAVDDTTIISAYVDSDGWTVHESAAGGIPEDHASTETTYGKGSGAYYGHVKLSDSVSSTDSSSSGVASTPMAVKTAYDKAVAAQTTANNAASAASAAQTTANEAKASAGYSKTETLADATKTGWGLPASAVPDDVFGWFVKATWSVKERIKTLNYSNVQEANPWTGANGTVTGTVYYSSQVAIAEDGTVSLVNRSSVSGKGTEYEKFNVIKGHFWQRSGYTTIWWTEADAADIKYGGSQGGGWMKLDSKEVTGVVTHEARADVNAYDRNAYPDDGYVGEFHYTYKGRYLDNIVSPTQIAAGSYTGTGNYGSSNKNTLTFDFEPKLVIINSSYYNILSLIMVRGSTTTSTGLTTSGHTVNVSWNGNSVTWYGTSNQEYQLSVSGYVYHYIAIG